MSAKFSIIAAMARNRVIGKDNQLPWHLSEDLRHFKEITMGHPIVMGRKTHESIGKALPGRENIILTRNQEYQAPECRTIHELSELSDLFLDQEVFIIGGEALYQLALPSVSKLYLTMIDKDFEGDAYFPEVDLENDFRIIDESERLTSAQSGLPYRFVKAVRK